MAIASALADALLIEGGRPLSGRIRAASNKNGALPILAACLLTEEPVTLSNVPRIRDVDTMLELLADLGADAGWTGANEVRVHAADVSKHAPRPRAVLEDPRLVPPGGAAAGAIRSRDDAAAGRRRDRTA